MLRLSLFLLALLLPRLVAAQDAPLLSDSARASLVTVLAGDELYSAWGHTAIRVADPETGLDVFYNYGTFDFDQPNFYLNFGRGFLLYQLSKERPEVMLWAYNRIGRPVIAQELALTPDEVRTLYARLEENFLPENRKYYYDFLRDNCSTRPRDQIEAVLGDRLSLENLPDPGLTFRQLLDSGLKSRPLPDFGLDLLLGARLDERASPYEATFLPEYLMHAFDAATVVDTSGQARPLVARTDTLVWIEGWRNEAAFPWPVALLWVLALATLLHAFWTIRMGSPDSRLQRGLDVLLFGFVGLGGIVMALMWFATAHYVTKANWNLLWAWPTHLAAALFLLFRPKANGLHVYFLVTTAVCVLVLLFWWAWPQALHPAVFPLVVVLGARTVRRALPLARRTLAPTS